MLTRPYTHVLILLIIGIIIQPLILHDTQVYAQDTPPPINILHEDATLTITGKDDYLKVYTVITYTIYSATTQQQTIMIPAQAPSTSTISITLNDKTIEPVNTGREYVAGKIALPIYKIILNNLKTGANTLRITYYYTAQYRGNKTIIVLPVSIHRINGQSYLANYSASIKIIFENLTDHKVTISLNTPEGEQLGYTITETITSPEKQFTLSIPVMPHLAGDLVVEIFKAVSIRRYYEVYPSSIVPSFQYSCLEKKLGVTIELTTHYSRYDIVDLKHWRVGKDIYISFYFYGYGLPSENETKKIYLHVMFDNILSGQYNVHIIINDHENLTLKYEAICPTTNKSPFTEGEVIGGILAIIVALSIIMAITTHVHRKKTQ